MSITPIKIPPGGTTRQEISWRKEIERLTKLWESGYTPESVYSAALVEILTRHTPLKIVPKEIIDGPESRTTNLGNRYLPDGQWDETECANGQYCAIFIPFLRKLKPNSMLRTEFIVELENGFRANYLPGTVISLLQKGYPVGR